MIEHMRRFNVWVCHRRLGKTVLAINMLIKKASENTNKRPRYHYIGPTYKQAKRVAWEYLKEYTLPLRRAMGGNPDKFKNESELWVMLPNGAKIFILGSDKPDSIRGEYSDGCVFDEYAMQNPYVWSGIVRPMLADRLGWVIFMGTPDGKDDFYDKYARYNELMASNDNYFACLFKASDTGIIADEELESAREEMSDEMYRQEFECDFTVAMRGAYYAKEIEEARQQNRIGSFSWQPEHPVHTVWDLGMADATSIWFYQKIGPSIQVIDFYENSNEGLEHYFKMLREKEYTYGDMTAPHDIKVRELGSGRSRYEMAKSHGINFKIARNLPIKDGIEAVRVILKRCYFDNNDNVKQGLTALSQYKKNYNESKKRFDDKPHHDWTSHAADSFRYLAVSYKEDHIHRTPRYEKTFDEILAEHDNMQAGSRF